VDAEISGGRLINAHWDERPERMNSREHAETAMRREVPDRVPVVPRSIPRMRLLAQSAQTSRLFPWLASCSGNLSSIRLPSERKLWLRKNAFTVGYFLSEFAWVMSARAPAVSPKAFFAADRFLYAW